MFWNGSNCLPLFLHYYNFIGSSKFVVSIFQNLSFQIYRGAYLQVWLTKGLSWYEELFHVLHIVKTVPNKGNNVKISKKWKIPCEYSNKACT